MSLMIQELFLIALIYTFLHGFLCNEYRRSIPKIVKRFRPNDDISIKIHKESCFSNYRFMCRRIREVGDYVCQEATN